MVAESPNHFLVFTDTFTSNPGNIQGACGASETGERFVHVVALGPYPHETLSVLIESCLLSIEPADATPERLPQIDSAEFVGKLKSVSNQKLTGPPLSTTYQRAAPSLGPKPRQIRKVAASNIRVSLPKYLGNGVITKFIA